MKCRGCGGAFGSFLDVVDVLEEVDMVDVRRRKARGDAERVGIVVVRRE